MADNLAARAVVLDVQRRMRRLYGVEPDPGPSHGEASASPWIGTHVDPDDPWAATLAGLLDDLQDALGRVEPDNADLGAMFFGSVPGGGLEAWCELVPGTNQCAVFLPSGLLVCCLQLTRLIISLLPLELDHSGLHHPPNAIQLVYARVGDPGVRFHLSDLLRSLFVYGDVRSSLPYWDNLPHEDYYEYLMTGFELFVLAHEVAHAKLGHLADGKAIEMADEIEADRYAIRVVEAMMQPWMTHPRAHALQAVSLFYETNVLWELALHQILGDTFDNRPRGEHPSPVARRARFVEEELGDPGVRWTPGSPVTLATINLVFRQLAAVVMPELEAAAARAGGVNARVLPRSLDASGRHTRIDQERNHTESVADLLTSKDPDRHLIGLWYVRTLKVAVTDPLIDGLIDDDEPAWQARCAAAIAAIDPVDPAGCLAQVRNLVAMGGDSREVRLACVVGLMERADAALGPARAALNPADPAFYSHPDGAVGPRRRRLWFTRRRS